MTPSSSPSDAISGNNERDIANSFATPTWYLRGYATNIQIRTETVTALVGDMDFEHILDVGCGDGSLSLPLLPRTRHVTYLDISRAMLDLVAQRIGPAHAAKARFLESGFMAAELPPRAFDLIISIGVLAYIEDVTAYLQKVRSIIVPGGRLLLECTDSAHFLSRLDRAYQAITASIRPRQFEIYQHTADSVLRAAADNGFLLHHAFRYTYSLPLISKLVTPRIAYRSIRAVYGAILNNRFSDLGNQCIFSLSCA